MDSNSNSYGIEPTIFNSNTNSNTNSNANCDANSSINYNANSIVKSNDAYETPA